MTNGILTAPGMGLNSDELAILEGHEKQNQITVSNNKSIY